MGEGGYKSPVLADAMGKGRGECLDRVEIMGEGRDEDLDWVEILRKGLGAKYLN